MGSYFDSTGSRDSTLSAMPVNTRIASSQMAMRSFRSVYTEKDSMERNMYSLAVFISSRWNPRCSALESRPERMSVTRSLSSRRTARSPTPVRLWTPCLETDLMIAPTHSESILSYVASSTSMPALMASDHLATAPAKSSPVISWKPCSMARSASSVGFCSTCGTAAGSDGWPLLSGK